MQARLAPSLSVGGEGAPPIVFNTQMRSELEVPLSTSESKGHAQVKILQDGTIEAVVIINNKVARASALGTFTT